MTRAELEQKAAQWISDNEGKSLDYDGVYGPQCFDEFQFYNRDVVGAPFVTGASAKDIVNTYPQDFYDFIENTADNFPILGDVPIWGTDLGPDGHVAVCKVGDPNTFTSLDQNWSWVPKCVLVQHSYFALLGWLRPKTQEPIVEQPAPEPQVTSTPIIEVPVTTTAGTTSVPITVTSTGDTPAPTLGQPIVLPPVEAKPIPEHGPTQAPWRISDLIVFLWTRIKSVLSKYEK